MSRQTPYQIDLRGLDFSTPTRPRGPGFGMIAVCFLVTLPLTIFTVVAMTALIKVSIPLMITITVVWVAWRLAQWCAWWWFPR